MANVAGQVWISKWNGRTVGTWNPLTNVYTPVFSTPSNAGGIAFDPDSNILWVGLQGGLVVPYTLAGVALNGGFLPFGSISQTIDGLTFLDLDAYMARRGLSYGPAIWLSKEDSHPNVAFHKAIAEFLYESLQPQLPKDG